MPIYNYECMTERGGCSQTWTEDKPMHDYKTGVMCPNCMSMMEDPCHFDAMTQTMVPRLQVLMPKRINIISDIDSQDGRTPGDKIPLPSAGADTVVGSRREREEAKKRLRESLYEQTRGEHVTMRPHKLDPNDPNSPVVFEKHTRVTEGHDMGEVIDVESNPERANRPKNAFKDHIPGEHLDEAEAILEQKVGPHEEPPKKRRGRPKGAKDKKPRTRRVKSGKA